MLPLVGIIKDLFDIKMLLTTLPSDVSKKLIQLSFYMFFCFSFRWRWRSKGQREREEEGLRLSRERQTRGGFKET